MTIDVRPLQATDPEIRRPVIVNQLGPEVGEALNAHWSRPTIIDGFDAAAPWNIPAGADVLLTRPGVAWKSRHDKPENWPGDLRWIQTASVGIDFYPDWFLSADGPTVSCGRGLAANPIADYVLAAILGFEKRLHEIAIVSPDAFRQSELGTLEGQTIGLLGFGAIGQAVAKRAFAFDMGIIAVRRNKTLGTSDGVRFVSGLEELVAQVDHLVLAAPLTAQTHHVVNRRVLSAAKSGLHIINVARGALIDQDALLAALETSRLGGATLDVTNPEPLPEGHPLYTHPKVRITPHISWNGTKNAGRLQERILSNLDAYARGLPVSDIVDPIQRY
jgi:phosphoglycerate dehydrogenase-like enzyme